MKPSGRLLAIVKSTSEIKYNHVPYEKINFIRYPGGKQRILKYIMPALPEKNAIKGKFVEPFVGSGAVFFALNPRTAILSDLNAELIDLYRGIRDFPLKIWDLFKDFPSTKAGYYKIRAMRITESNLVLRAARMLYLNRTCFKGMWRHNAYGEFNVGYGGQDRRWVVSKESLLEISTKLRHASLRHYDFEEIIDSCGNGDFIFADPPYCPGERELFHSHYTYGQFSYNDHVRLANTLKRASDRGVEWALTTSSHSDILRLFEGYGVMPMPIGTGNKPGLLTSNSGEVLVTSYK